MEWGATEENYDHGRAHGLDGRSYHNHGLCPAVEKIVWWQCWRRERLVQCRGMMLKTLLVDEQMRVKLLNWHWILMS